MLLNFVFQIPWTFSSKLQLCGKEVQLPVSFFNYLKGSYTGDPDCPSAGSLTKWLQLGQSKAMSFSQVSRIVIGTQGLGPSSAVFPGHQKLGQK